MVRIERVNTEKTALAIHSLEEEKAKSNGRCNTDEVVEALIEIFHNKCYLCESESASSWEVEHLIPHCGNKDIKFDWKNLFWACGHCNHIKGDKFNPILDCTKVDVDKIISFRKVGYFGVDESLTFEKVSDYADSQGIQMTCSLLQRIYYGKTPQEKVSAKILRHKIRTELTEFKNYVRDYLESTGEDKMDLFLTIRKNLKSNSKFAAFKRWIVRDNPNCKDFVDCWKS